MTTATAPRRVQAIVRTQLESTSLRWIVRSNPAASLPWQGTWMMTVDAQITATNRAPTIAQTSKGARPSDAIMPSARSGRSWRSGGRRPERRRGGVRRSRIVEAQASASALSPVAGASAFLRRGRLGLGMGVLGLGLSGLGTLASKLVSLGEESVALALAGLASRLPDLRPRFEHGPLWQPEISNSFCFSMPDSTQILQQQYPLNIHSRHYVLCLRRRTRRQRL